MGNNGPYWSQGHGSVPANAKQMTGSFLRRLAVALISLAVTGADRKDLHLAYQRCYKHSIHRLQRAARCSTWKISLSKRARLRVSSGFDVTPTERTSRFEDRRQANPERPAPRGRYNIATDKMGGVVFDRAQSRCYCCVAAAATATCPWTAYFNAGCDTMGVTVSALRLDRAARLGRVLPGQDPEQAILSTSYSRRREGPITLNGCAKSSHKNRTGCDFRNRTERKRVKSR